MPSSARSSSRGRTRSSSLVSATARWAAPAAKPEPTGSERAAQREVEPFEEWCQYVDISPKAGGTIPFARESWNVEQVQLERDRTGRDVIVKARQVGVSTKEWARDLWMPIKFPGTHTLCIVNDDEDRAKLTAVFRVMMQGLERHERLPPITTRRAGEIVFAKTGSTLRWDVAGATTETAEKKGRSGALRRLHCTEVAFWGEATATLGAARQAVPQDGEIVLESTANGAAGAFYDEATSSSKESGYTVHFLPWFLHEEYRRAVDADFDAEVRDDHEREMRKLGVDDSQIAWWRWKVAETKDLERVLQEYPYSLDVAFRAGGGQYIDPTTCDWLAAHVVEPISIATFRGLQCLIYEPPREGELYVIGADVAEGTGLDASTACVKTRREGRTVATAWSDSIEPGDFGWGLAGLGRMYRNAVVGPERNNHGHTVIRAMQHEAKYPGKIYEHDDGKLGWHTTTANRSPLFDELADMWRGELDEKTGKVVGRELPTPDRRTAGEARTLTRVNGKPQARGKGTKGGAKDDAYVAEAIALQVRQRIGSGRFKFHRAA